MVCLSVAHVKPEASMSETVKCVDCGFLALRRRTSLELVNPGDAYRQRGELPTDNGRLTFDESPVCTAGAFDFGPFHGRGRDAYMQARSERQCSSFTKCIPALSPLEHYEMLRESDRLQWQRQQDEAARTFQAEQAKLADQRHRENLAIAIKAAQGNVWSTLIAGVIGALATLAAGAIGYFLGHH